MYHTCQYVQFIFLLTIVDCLNLTIFKYHTYQNNHLNITPRNIPNSNITTPQHVPPKAHAEPSSPSSQSAVSSNISQEVAAQQEDKRHGMQEGSNNGILAPKIAPLLAQPR